MEVLSMKKLTIIIALLASFLFASPTFAYTVKSGDTMSQIAVDHHLTLQELASLNPQIKNLDLIYVEQTVNTGNNENTGNEENKENTAKQEMKVGISDYEKDLLARLVRAEAEGEPLEGQIAVACVVLNRVDSPDFPKTIKDVIYERGQFQPVRNGEINKPADEDAIKAVNEALTEYRNVAAGSLFFYNPVTASSHWLDSRETAVVIGSHVFKK
jgi:N-acetylmuramoyl-L-alanine amidase